MAEELQQLLEKIQHDGVEKANAEAATILAKAKADAAAILKDAESKAAALRAQAETDAKAFEERAQKTIFQAARDTVLEVKDAIGRMLEKLLAKDVAAALADPSEAAKLALAAVNELGSNADVAAGEKLAAALKAQLAADAKAGVKVVLDESGRPSCPRRASCPPRRRTRGTRLLRVGHRRRTREAPAPGPRQARECLNQVLVPSSRFQD